MFRKKALWIVLAVLALVAGGSYAAYAAGLTGWLEPQGAVEEERTLDTATITRGDIAITADGSGVLVAASEVNLAFGSSGTLTELLVQVGDVVEAGEVLARIDDTDARKALVDAELSVLQAEEALEDAQDTAALEQAVAQAKFDVAQTEADLEAARSDLEDLVEWTPDEADVEIAQANLSIAQADYQVTVAKANMRDDETTSVRVNLEEAIRDLEEAQVNYANAMDAARDWEKNIETTRENAAGALQKAQDSLEVAQANYNLQTVDTSSTDVQNAWVKVLDAQDTLDDLQAPPEASEITQAQLEVQALEVALQQSKLDLADAREALVEANASGAEVTEAKLTLEQARLKLESAQTALEGATLVAPISGTVVEINAQVGETVSGTAVVLADLSTPVVQFWVEESDLNSVAVGNRVSLVFEALPDLTYEEDVSGLSKDRLAGVRNAKIGFVFQSYNLLPRLTAVKNVMVPMLYNGHGGMTDGERRERAVAALEAVGLGDRINHRPNEMSGGQQQRVAIARALVNEPSILLADEPTGNLDTRSSEDIMELLHDLHDGGATIVMVTHELDIAQHAERVIYLVDGQIVSDREYASGIASLHQEAMYAQTNGVKENVQ